MTPAALPAAVGGPFATRQSAGFFVPVLMQRTRITNNAKYLVSVGALDVTGTYRRHWFIFYNNFRRSI
jgi:hypothetical protein